MFTNLKHLHFIGICGTAMGAVAAALRDQSYTVTGSDEDVYPPMSTFLEEKGIVLNRGYRAENLPASAELIVIGNAIRRGNPEVEAVLNGKLPYCSLPEVLKFFFLRGRHNMVVSGTHGKTTTTSLLTWILQSAGLAPGYMIGGLPKNLGQGAQFNASPYYVIEGDEYDTAFFDKRSKFVHYLPELLIINNIEFDHADIYNEHRRDQIKLPAAGQYRAGQRSHSLQRRRCQLRRRGGRRVFGAPAHRPDRSRQRRADSGCPLRRGRNDVPTFRRGIHHAAHGRVQRAQLRDGHRRRPLLQHLHRRHPPGPAQLYRGAPPPGIARGSSTGSRSWTISAITRPPSTKRCSACASSRARPAKIWALFEPRSNSTRRAVFQDQLAGAFEHADGVVMSRVAKLEQIPEAERLHPEAVVDAIRASGKPAFYEDGTSAIIGRVKAMAHPGDMIVVFSNGGFDGIHA